MEQLSWRNLGLKVHKKSSNRLCKIINETETLAQNACFAFNNYFLMNISSNQPLFFSINTLTCSSSIDKFIRNIRWEWGAEFTLETLEIFKKIAWTSLEKSVFFFLLYITTSFLFFWFSSLFFFALCRVV